MPYCFQSHFSILDHFHFRTLKDFGKLTLRSISYYSSEFKVHSG